MRIGDIKVYPNPNNGSFTISVQGPEGEDANCAITNILGQKVSEFSLRANTAKEIALHQPAGVYLLSVSGTGARQVVKLVVE